MKPNRQAEDILYNLVATSWLNIDSEGRIWRQNGTRAEHRTPAGYLQVRVMVKGIRYHIGAHRLVWRKFNGEIPEGKIINHINGQKDDNRPWNLELNTASDNIRHAHRHGLLDQSGQKNPAAKLTDKQVAEIRLAYTTGGFTQEQLAQKYGVSYQCISKVVRGDRRSRQPGQTGNYEHLRQRNTKQDPVTGRFVSKKAAGRLLDGRTWDEMPRPDLD